MTTIIITIGMAIVSLLGGCAMGSEPIITTDPITTANLIVEARTAVISEIEDQYKIEATIAQWNEIASIPVVIMTRADFNVKFSPDAWAWCNDSGIYVADDVPAGALSAVLAHEFVHEVSVVLLDQPDNCHVDKQLFSCEDSIEYRAARDIGWTGTRTDGYSCGVSSCR
jgi:hypothetical protein